MLLDFGRGPILFSVIEVATALDEEILDLPQGCRGFFLRDRAASATLRISNIKGEVAKAATVTPVPKFWSIDKDFAAFELQGFRVMEADAEDGGIALGEQPDGTVLEQRFYVTSETAGTDIEVLIIPAA